MSITKAEQFILDKYKNNYPTAIPILDRLLEGETVADLAVEYGIKEQTIRNLKSRYRGLFK